MSYELVIGEDFNGVKPKNFLKKKLDLPYHILFKHLKNKRITLNGKKIKEDSILKKGDIIKVWLDSIQLRQKESFFKQAQNLHMNVLYEQKEFLVLNKLPGVVVQGAQDSSESLSLHLAHLKEKNQDTSDFDYVHIHRLDKETSGVLVVGKTLQATRELNRIFKSRSLEKKYLALVVGKLPQRDGKVEIYLSRAEQGQREKVVVSSKKNLDAKLTLSEYRVLEEFQKDFQQYSLVEVTLKTGFMHQIRVHMKHLGCPIVGDKMYGISRENSKFESVLSRQFLHANSLKFVFEEQEFFFEAPLLEDLKKTLDFLKH